MFNSLFSPLLLLVAVVVVVVWITLIIYWTFVIYRHAAWEHLLCLVKTLMHGIKWLISLFYYLSLACFEQVLCRHSDPSFHLNIDACCCSHKIRASVILVSQNDCKYCRYLTMTCSNMCLESTCMIIMNQGLLTQIWTKMTNKDGLHHLVMDQTPPFCNIRPPVFGSQHLWAVTPPTWRTQPWAK